MSIKRAFTVAAAAAALTVLVAPLSSASAAESGGQPAKAPRLAAADGRLHVYTQPNGGGNTCSWLGNADSWGSCRNLVSDIWNNGYAGGNDAVDLYWGLNATGAHACISQGDRWPDLTTGRYHFTYDSGKPGFGDSLNNNVSSHRWVDYCSQG
ncbi:hypothetical protein ACIRU3_18820 [Streptomyces sp. NPDC101151]|uniref:hypothetical protein n=1 Tax=Streptomyces sp. NPDC101151 TaxID=3366115 RepID=UPI003821E842